MSFDGLSNLTGFHYAVFHPRPRLATLSVVFQVTKWPWYVELHTVAGFDSSGITPWAVAKFN